MIDTVQQHPPLELRRLLSFYQSPRRCYYHYDLRLLATILGCSTAVLLDHVTASLSEHINTTSTYWKPHLLNGTSEVSVLFTY